MFFFHACVIFAGPPAAGAPDPSNPLGTVFRVTTNGVLTTLVSFNNTNGSSPADGLTAGQDGNFYGTTANGGSHLSGTVFRITPGGVVTTLVSFNGTNGASPQGGLVQDNDGNLYGTTAFGGTTFGTNSSFGTIFKVTTNGALTTLFNFHFIDGKVPSAKMIFGNDGNLYGTTEFGGVPGGANGLGTVFRITTNGIFTSLIRFQRTNGSIPLAPLVLGNDGNLYGTTSAGGTGSGGTIFQIVLTPQITDITRGPDGSVRLIATGPSGATLRLLASTNISLPIASWTSLTNGAFNTNGQFSFTDTTAATAKARFYRISTP